MQQTCSSEEIKFIKDFIIINESKTEFCYDLFHKALKFDNNRFKSYLTDVRFSLAQILIYRANLYCALCDVHQQKFFNPVSQVVTFSENFCEAMLLKNKNLIMFLNVYFIEYVDVVLQLIQCYDADAQPKVQELDNFLTRYKR